MAESYLIIGSGPAGITAAENIRTHDKQAAITVISEEKSPMIYRPKIPEYATGKLTIEKMMIKKMAFYEQNDINLRLGKKAKKLETLGKIVETSDSRHYKYDRLIIATGIAPVQPQFPGADLSGVFTMHDLIQADKLNAYIKNIPCAVVVGGGLLGMDMAEVLKINGIPVDFLIRRPVLGDPFFDPYGCSLVEKEFRDMGINVITNTEVHSMEGIHGKLAKTLLTNGNTIESTFCFVAIGAVQAINWLKDSGIKVDKGILVDEYLQSSDESIFAAGNAAQIIEPVLGKHIVQTNWMNAVTQGSIAGNNITKGKLMRYQGTSHYFKKIGTLAFNLLGTGNSIIENGKRTRFNEHNSREYIMITSKDNTILGAVVCGYQKHILNLKKAIESQQKLQQLENLTIEEEGCADELLNIL